MAKRRFHEWATDPDAATAPSPAERAPSRSQLKRQAKHVTELGAALVDLPPKTLAKLPLDDELREAIEACRGLKRGGARVRQSRLVGKLLREGDAASVATALAAITSDPHEKAALLKVAQEQSGDDGEVADEDG